MIKKYIFQTFTNHKVKILQFFKNDDLHITPIIETIKKKTIILSLSNIDSLLKIKGLNNSNLPIELW